MTRHLRVHALGLLATAVMALMAGACSFDALQVKGKPACTDCKSLPAGYALQIAVSGLDEPESFDWLPDGRMLITEKNGTVRVDQFGTPDSTPWATVPRVDAIGKRGLTGIAVREDSVYIYYETLATDTDASPIRTLLRLDQTGAIAPNGAVMQSGPITSSESAMGGILRVSPDGDMYTVTANQGAQATDPANANVGNLLKFSSATLDGAGPIMPEVLAPDVATAWGLSMRPDGGVYYVSESGSSSSLNLLRPSSETAPGPDQPAALLPPEAPIRVYGYAALGIAGIEFYTGNRLAQFNNNLFVCATPGSGLHRLVLDPTLTKVAGDTLLSRDCSGDVRIGPDGNLYFADVTGGRIWRITNGHP